MWDGTHNLHIFPVYLFFKGRYHLCKKAMEEVFIMSQEKVDRYKQEKPIVRKISQNRKSTES